MATTQKRKATGAPRKKRPEAKQPPAAQPVRRELWGLICLLLAVFAAFGYFKIDALFVDWFGKLLKGLFGYGFWFVPPVLLFTSIILIFTEADRWRAGSSAPCC